MEKILFQKENTTLLRGTGEEEKDGSLLYLSCHQNIVDYTVKF
jgi:hypothetical protein